MVIESCGGNLLGGKIGGKVGTDGDVSRMSLELLLGVVVLELLVLVNDLDAMLVGGRRPICGGMVVVQSHYRGSSGMTAGNGWSASTI